MQKQKTKTSLQLRFFTILKYISILGLFLFLVQSFYKANIEPAFWIMGISLALAGIFATKKENEFVVISKKFVWSTVFFVMAVSFGGIFTLVGGNIGGYDVFSKFILIEYGGTSVLWGLFGLVCVSLILGVIDFIEGIYELFILQKDDKV
jgi:hypothetical protein